MQLYPVVMFGLIISQVDELQLRWRMEVSYSTPRVSSCLEEVNQFLRVASLSDWKLMEHGQ